MYQERTVVAVVALCILNNRARWKIDHVNELLQLRQSAWTKCRQD